MVHFPQTFLSHSVSITLFFHPKKPPVSQYYFFPFTKCNSIPHTFFTENTLPTFLKQPRTTFTLAFRRLVSINARDNLKDLGFFFFRENILGWHQTSFIFSPKSLLVQFSSVAQSCPTLCDPMNCSTPGLPVHHQLLEFTQTHVH